MARTSSYFIVDEARKQSIQIRAQNATLSDAYLHREGTCVTLMPHFIAAMFMQLQHGLLERLWRPGVLQGALECCSGDAVERSTEVNA